jgi:hypothetical protein
MGFPSNADVENYGKEEESKDKAVESALNTSGDKEIRQGEECKDGTCGISGNDEKS